MTLHAAPVPSAGKRYFAMPPCPQCGDTLLAPESLNTSARTRCGIAGRATHAATNL